MKPILFNTEMARAILDGQKTTTRRVVKPKPAGDGSKPEELFITRPGYWNTFGDDNVYRQPYKTGDILYVRETWAHPSETEIANGADPKMYLYKADSLQPAAWDRWRPSIHMPKEAARIFLRVTNVRVERLFDSFFKRGAAIFALRAEGITLPEVCANCIDTYGYPCCNDEDEGGSECGNLDDVRYDFSTLWDSTIKPADRPLYGWEADPWVWVIEFERASKDEAYEEANQDGKL